MLLLLFGAGQRTNMKCAALGLGAVHLVRIGTAHILKHFVGAFVEVWLAVGQLMAVYAVAHAVCHFGQ